MPSEWRRKQLSGNPLSSRQPRLFDLPVRPRDNRRRNRPVDNRRRNRPLDNRSGSRNRAEVLPDNDGPLRLTLRMGIAAAFTLVQSAQPRHGGTLVSNVPCLSFCGPLHGFSVVENCKLGHPMLRQQVSERPTRFQVAVDSLHGIHGAADIAKPTRQPTQLVSLVHGNLPGNQ